jgi:hypothetical protein
MKKNIVIVTMLALATIASADIFVSLTSSFGISDGGDASGNTPLLAAGEQARVQLIYDANGDGVGQAAIGAVLSGDDVEVANFLTPAAVAGDFYREFGVWDQVNLTQLGAAGGTVYARIFQDSSVGAGSFYYEDSFVASDLNTATTPPPTPELFDVGGGGVALASSTVIPEPATIGLLGIAGAGLFAARRKTRA